MVYFGADCRPKALLLAQFAPEWGSERNAMGSNDAVLKSGKAINRLSDFAMRIASGEMHLPASLEDGSPLNTTGARCEASFDDSWDQWNNSWSNEFDNYR